MKKNYVTPLIAINVVECHQLAAGSIGDQGEGGGDFSKSNSSFEFIGSEEED